MTQTLQPQHIIPYFQVRGWGTVSKTVPIGSFISQASAGIRPDEIRIGVGDFRPFVDWEGATVYLEGASGGANPKAADGYYTIIAVSQSPSRITLKGAGVVPAYSTTLVGYGSATVRLEDFYKVTQGGYPDFVTGQNAQANWLPYLLGTTDTISQKIEPPGGIATIDGFTFKVQYKSDDEEIQDFLRRLPISVFSSGNTPIYVEEDENTLDGPLILRLNTEPDLTYLADSESGGELIFDGIPLLVNGEAIVIESYDSGLNKATVTRKVLKTQKTWQSYGTLLSHSLPQSQGQIIEFYEIPNIARCFDRTAITDNVTPVTIDGASSLYFGVIDNVNFDKGITAFDIEVSSVLLKAKAGKVPSRFRDAGQLEFYRDLDIDIGDPVLEAMEEYFPKLNMCVPIESRFSGFNWSWIQLGNIALRIGLNRKALVPTAWRREKLNQIPSYKTFYPIQDVLSFTIDDVVTYSSQRYADFCVIEKFSTTDDFNRIANYNPESRPVDRSNNFWLFRLLRFLGPTTDTVRGLVWAVEDITNIDGRGTANRENDDFSKIQPCHIFEIGGGPYKEGNRTTATIASQRFPRPLESGAEEIDSNLYIYQSVIDIRDLILQILTSISGKQVNPVIFRYYDSIGNLTSTIEQTFDYLPEGVGLGIPGDLIDTTSEFFMIDPASFASRLPGGTDVGFNMANVFVTAKDAEDMLDWLKKKILEPLGYALVQTNKGLVSLIDLADVRNKQFPEILISNLYIDGDKIAPEVPQNYDNTRIISSIRQVTYAPQVRFYDSTAITTTAVETPYGDTLDTPALTWGQVAQQNSGKNLNFDNLFTIREVDLAARAVKVLGAYNVPTSEIEFRMKDEDLFIFGSIDLNRPFFRNIGSVTPIRLDNIVNTTGSRGGLQYGLIKSITRDFQSKTSIVKFLLLTRPVNNNFIKRWTASGEVLSATSTVISLVPAFYTIADDTQGFQVDDLVVLLSENMELLSQPRTIASISTNQITLSSTFTLLDGSGPITASASDIIVHAPIDLQPILPVIRANSLANFSILPEDDPYDTTRYI